MCNYSVGRGIRNHNQVLSLFVSTRLLLCYGWNRFAFFPISSQYPMGLTNITPILLFKSQIGHYQTNIQYTPNKIHHPDIKIQTQRRRYCWSTLQSCATGVQLFPERVLTFHILCRHDFWHSNGTYSSISVKLKITRK